ncbi:MAG TPA: hypothetical protein DDY71_05245 [Spirochaetia bacterium]|nr:hypothetical protein [Spirochaetia bacterium]
MKIYEYIEPENNNQKIIYGTPFLVIAYYNEEWELCKVSWYDIKYNLDTIRNLYNNLMTDLMVSSELFEKYFRFSSDINE